MPAFEGVVADLHIVADATNVRPDSVDVLSEFKAAWPGLVKLDADSKDLRRWWTLLAHGANVDRQCSSTHIQWILREHIVDLPKHVVCNDTAHLAAAARHLLHDLFAVHLGHGSSSSCNSQIPVTEESR